MSILVLDHIAERKLALENALIRAGYLLTERLATVAMSLQEMIENSNIIIILDEHGDTILPANSQDFIGTRMVIGRGKGINNLAIKNLKLLDCDEDEVIDSTIKIVSGYYYRNFFPVTKDEKMQAMLSIAKKVAPSSASILIEGETGTGKEVIAKYIHQNSVCADGPFIAINCAAIPETMIEAVLFGYEKGAFTNAINSYIGKFEQANNGTLFLDEIAEMSVDLQAKLLRVLQENEIERIGGKGVHKVDIRVIAATNQNLYEQIRDGNFRSDLYYRLNVINLKCPPLRQRLADIELMAEYFIKIFSQELGLCVPSLSKDGLDKLLNYKWMGNVRELKNVMQRSVILDEDGIIDGDDISFSMEASDSKSGIMTGSLRETEAEKIVNTLIETKGCRSDAAKKLKISPRTLRYKISKLKENGLDVP
jgi:two-component system response regulator FlrC